MLMNGSFAMRPVSLGCPSLSSTETSKAFRVVSMFRSRWLLAPCGMSSSRETLLRAMQISGAEAQFVSQIAEEWMRARGLLATGEADRNPERNLLRSQFDILPVAIQRRIIQSQVLGLKIAPEFDLIERLR